MKNPLFIVLIFTTYFCGAQIKATTEGGKTVLLNDDKTWQYQTGEKGCEYINVDKDGVSLKPDLLAGRKFEGESDYYFKIYTSMNTISNISFATMGFELNTSYSSTTSIFGKNISWVKVFLTLENGENIILNSFNENGIKAKPKTNGTQYLGSFEIAKDQLVKLVDNKIAALNVNWGGQKLNFEVIDDSIFINQIPCLK